MLSGHLHRHTGHAVPMSYPEPLVLRVDKLPEGEPLRPRSWVLTT